MHFCTEAGAAQDLNKESIARLLLLKVMKLNMAINVTSSTLTKAAN